MPDVTAILYHAITQSESDFERGLGVATSPDRFAAHVDYFDKNYDIIDLDTLVSGKLPRRPLLITFDDVYRSVVSAARDILKPRNIPSVFFVNPSLVGRQAIGLDNLLAFCVNRYGLGPVCESGGFERDSLTSVGDIISDVASNYTSSERAGLKTRLTTEFGLTADQLNERCAILEQDDLRECAALGMEVGNHTATHVHGRSLAPSELGSEIAEARRALETMAGHPVRAFSLPYGSEIDLTEPVLRTIRDSGHKATFLVQARSNRVRPAPDVWYRISLRNEHPSQLPLKLTLLPLLRSVKKRLLR